jgi:hypothetical protein
MIQLPPIILNVFQQNNINITNFNQALNVQNNSVIIHGGNNGVGLNEGYIENGGDQYSEEEETEDEYYIRVIQEMLQQGNLYWFDY